MRTIWLAFLALLFAVALGVGSALAPWAFNSAWDDPAEALIGAESHRPAFTPGPASAGGCSVCAGLASLHQAFDRHREGIAFRVTNLRVALSERLAAGRGDSAIAATDDLSPAALRAELAKAEAELAAAEQASLRLSARREGCERTRFCVAERWKTARSEVSCEASAAKFSAPAAKLAQDAGALAAACGKTACPAVDCAASRHLSGRLDALAHALAVASGGGMDMPAPLKAAGLRARLNADADQAAGDIGYLIGALPMLLDAGTDARAREVVRVALDAASRRAKMLDDAERAVRNDDAVPLAVRVRLRALAGDVATLAAFTVDETAGEERWFALVDALSGAVVGADLLKAALAAEGKGADGEACAPRAAAAELAAVAEALDLCAARARCAASDGETGAALAKAEATLRPSGSRAERSRAVLLTDELLREAGALAATMKVESAPKSGGRCVAAVRAP